MSKKIRNIFLNGPVTADFISTCIQKHREQTGIGAHSIFLGQVRGDILDEKKVKTIEYTAYEEMALEEMDRIREEIFERYQLTCLHVHHSIGKVDAGEICLFVLTSSAHRKAAIGACEEIVERIKKDLPIWGRELFEDDTWQWKENKI